MSFKKSERFTIHLYSVFLSQNFVIQAFTTITSYGITPYGPFQPILSET